MTELEAQRRAALERTLAIVAGAAPIAEIGRHMDAAVIVHMDAIPFVGLDGWIKWIRYQRAHARVVDVELELVEVELVGADLWRVWIRGSGRGRLDGRPRRSAPVEIRYRWAGLQIVEAWTRRRNYEFFFGPKIRTSLGFVGLLARIVAWNLLNPSTPTQGEHDHAPS